MAKKFWDEEKLIGEVEKSKNTTIKFKVVKKDGVLYGESREWFTDKNGEEMPTKKGHCLTVEQIDDFIAHWEMVRDELKKMAGKN